MQLAQDIGHRHMIVIRFNPDAYETTHGEKIPSCWKLNKKGIVDIPSEQKKNWDARIETLLKRIQYWSFKWNNLCCYQFINSSIMVSR